MHNFVACMYLNKHRTVAWELFVSSDGYELIETWNGYSVLSNMQSTHKPLGPHWILGCFKRTRLALRVLEAYCE